MQTRPRFRIDLVAQPVMEEGQRFVDVTDPDSGNTFRFYEVEYAVACAMDGKRDVPNLVAWSQSELGLQPSANEIETVVSTLEELGYLTAEEIRAAAGGGDFELGTAGKSEMSAPRPANVAAPDVELGHVDRADSEAETSVPVDAVEMGSAGGEISVDLSNHIPVVASDINDAVRQSKPMSVVADDEATIAEDSSPSIELNMDSPTGAQPIEIPQKPPKAAVLPKVATAKAVSEPLHDVADSKAGPLPQPSGGGSGMLAVLFIVLVAALCAGGWYVYQNYVKTDAGEQGQVKPASTAKPAVAVQKKKTPITARLEETRPSSATLLAPQQGAVAWVDDVDEVEEGSVVIKLRGADRWEKKLKESAARMGTYQDKLDKAQEKGDKAAMDAAAAKVEEKARELEDLKANLAKLTVLAPRAGLLELKIGMRDKVAEGAELGAVTGEFETQASFKADSSNYKAGANVTLVDIKDPSKKASCTVAELAAQSVVVTCVGGLPGGSQVELK